METLERTQAQPAATSVPKPRRYALDELDLSPGKKARLYRMMYEHGPGNGTMLFLPIDQGLEHGPIDFFVNPAALDPGSSHFPFGSYPFGCAPEYKPTLGGFVQTQCKFGNEKSRHAGPPVLGPRDRGALAGPRRDRPFRAGGPESVV